MKVFLVFLLVVIGISRSYGQNLGSFKVNGDFNTFYPITFIDPAWGTNPPVLIQLYRFIHDDSQWRGSMNGTFQYQTNEWGGGSNFIQATLAENQNGTGGTYVPFVAGWLDASLDNQSSVIVIWFRGGGTTYHFNCNYVITPTVYDGVVNPLPFLISGNGGGTHSYTSKTAIDPYVNPTGISSSTTVYYTATGNNYFAGNVGIGTMNPQSALAVNGQISAKSVQVSLGGWSDDVFDKSYKLPSLTNLALFIGKYKHLPDMPDKAEVLAKGIDVGVMNKKLLAKIEELTIYLINQDKRLNSQQKKIEKLQTQIQH